MISSAMTMLWNMFRPSAISSALLRYLVNRSLQCFLKNQIDPDQFQFELSEGIATVRDIELNVDYLNELIEEYGIVKVDEGYIGELSLHVPTLSNFFEDHVEFIINDFELSLNPLQKIQSNDVSQLVTSVTEAVTKSIYVDASATAQEYFKNLSDPDTENPAVKEMANTIELIMKRVKFVFNNVVVRIETDRNEYQKPLIAIETYIERLEFTDETPLPKEPSAMDPNNIIKLLKVQNVKMYTDIFCDSGDEMDSSDSVKENEKIDLSKVKTSDINLKSCPTQFANIPGDHTVKIVVHNANKTDSKNIAAKHTEIQIDLEESLFFYLTPTQISLLHHILAQMAPMSQSPKMAEENVDLMNESYHTESHYAYGVPKTSYTNVLTTLQEDFDQISLDNASPISKECPQKLNEAASPQENLHFQLSDCVELTFRVANIVGLVTHDDPLRKAKIFEPLSIRRLSRLTHELKELRNDAVVFFTTIADLNERHECGDRFLYSVYSGANLRLIVESFQLSHVFKTDGTNNAINFGMSFKNIELFESLPSISIRDGRASDTVRLFNCINDGTLQIELQSRWQNGEQGNYDFNFNIPSCQGTFDPSIIDRLSNLIALTSNSPMQSSILRKKVKQHENSSTLKIQGSIKKFKINLCIPIVDPSNRNSSNIRNLHKEKLQFEISSLQLEFPRFLVNDFATFVKFQLQFSSITGFFLDASNKLELLKNDCRFFNVSMARNDCVSIEYDFRNKSLLNENDKTTSIFTSKQNSIDNIKLEIPGTPDELSEFANAVQLNSDINVEAHLSFLNLYFVNKRFLEAFCGIAADLNAFASNMMQQFKQNFDGECDSLNETSFAHSFLHQNNPETSALTTLSTFSHKISTKLTFDSVKVLVGTSSNQKKTMTKAQIGFALNEAEFFVVSGYQGCLDSTYCYFATRKNTIVHRNLIDRTPKFFNNVRSDRFIGFDSFDIVAASQNPEIPSREHDLVAAIRLCPRLNKKTKISENVATLAIVARNMLIHFRPFMDLNHFWAPQLVQFFNITPNPTNANPSDLIFESNVRLEAISIEYEHKTVAENNPMVVELNIGCCDIVNLAKPSAYFQETTMFLRCDELGSHVQEPVKFLEVAMLVAELNFVPHDDDASKETIDVFLKDVAVKTWFCHDTLFQLLLIFKEFSDSKYGTVFETTEEEEKRDENPVSPSILSNITAAIEDAMNPVSSDDNNEDDDGFVMCDASDFENKIPNSQPKVRIFRPVVIITDYLQTLINARNDVLHLPDGHPKPLFALRVEITSLQVFLFGGHDFDGETVSKPYSRFNEASTDKYGHDDSLGGTFRDHTVCVELTAKKILHLCQTFDNTGLHRSLNVLFVHNWEVFDRVVASEITTLLVSETDSDYRRINPVPSFSARLSKDRNYEGRIRCRVKPLKINIDQDTLQFLSDFFGCVCAGLFGLFPDDSVPEILPPQIEIPGCDEHFNSQGYTVSNAPIDGVSVSAKPTVRERLYTQFEFVAPCKIKLDYTGKHVDLSHPYGTISGIISGVVQLTNTEVTLKSFDETGGLLGFSKCITFALNEWVSDVITQLPSNVGSLRPISPFANFLYNIRDGLVYTTNKYPSLRTLLAPWYRFQHNYLK